MKNVALGEVSKYVKIDLGNGALVSSNLQNKNRLLQKWIIGYNDIGVAGENTFHGVMIIYVTGFVKLKVSPSNNPRSLSLRWGITSNAINDKVMNGEPSVEPASFPAISIMEYCCAT